MADPNNALLADQRIVLMMVCKAANSSIKRAFADVLDVPDYGLPQDEFAPHRKFDMYFPTPNKLTAMKLKGEGYRVIGFARHPLARLVSCYKNKIRDRIHKPFIRKYGGAVWHNMPFAEWCAFVCRTPDGIADQHFRSASWGMLDNDGHMIPDKVFRVDDDGWWEKMRKEVVNWCGVDIGSERIINTTQGDDWPTFYTAELRREVEERFATDMRVYGYQ